MLQVARLSRRTLADASALVAEFLGSQLTAGAYVNRAGNPDLYYTLFGMQCAAALELDHPADEAAAYLRTFGDGADLDLVHLASLARCWASLPAGVRGGVPVDAMAANLEAHRRPDGGYAPAPASERGTVYAGFLALGAYQDLGRPLPEPERLVAAIESQRTADGGYANRPGQPVGLTPPTTAAAIVLRHLEAGVDPRLGGWLLDRLHPEGGFHASPRAPMPDLLSTATALHALDGLGIPLQRYAEPCLDYVDTLWTNRGGFYGHWADDAQDVEYTFYGLLAIGSLA